MITSTFSTGANTIQNFSVCARILVVHSVLYRLRAGTVIGSYLLILSFYSILDALQFCLEYWKSCLTCKKEKIIIRNLSKHKLIKGQVFIFWTFFEYWTPVQRRSRGRCCKTSVAFAHTLRARKSSQWQICPKIHLVKYSQIVKNNIGGPPLTRFPLKTGSDKIIYWLGRYSFLLGFIM